MYQVMIALFVGQHIYEMDVARLMVCFVDASTRLDIEAIHLQIVRLVVNSCPVIPPLRLESRRHICCCSPRPCALAFVDARRWTSELMGQFLVQNEKKRRIGETRCFRSFYLATSLWSLSTCGVLRIGQSCRNLRPELLGQPDHGL